MENAVNKTGISLPMLPAMMLASMKLPVIRRKARIILLLMPALLPAYMGAQGSCLF